MINKALGQGEARKMQDATQAWEKKTHIYIYIHTHTQILPQLSMSQVVSGFLRYSQLAASRVMAKVIIFCGLTFFYHVLLWLIGGK